MTAFIGVRISWVMLARNSLFARFACSALCVASLQRLLVSLALGDVAGGGEHALQLPVAVVEGGRVVGDHGFLAVPVARGQLVVGDLAFALSTSLMPASARSGSVK